MPESRLSMVDAQALEECSWRSELVAGPVLLLVELVRWRGLAGVETVFAVGVAVGDLDEVDDVTQPFRVLLDGGELVPGEGVLLTLIEHLCTGQVVDKQHHR